MESELENTPSQHSKGDPILDLAIHYALNRSYPIEAELSADKKRAVRKRAQTLKAESGEVFVIKKDKRLRVITSRNEQEMIVESCHSDPSSGHFGLTKTWRRIAERFYWKGMMEDVNELVSFTCIHNVTRVGSPFCLGEKQN